MAAPENQEQRLRLRGGARRVTDDEIQAAYAATRNDAEAARRLHYADSSGFGRRRRRLGLPARTSVSGPDEGARRRGGRRRVTDDEIVAAYHATSNDEEGARRVGFADRTAFGYRRRKLGLPALGIRDLMNVMVSRKDVRKTLHAHRLGRKATVVQAAAAIGVKPQTYLSRIKEWDLPVGHRRRHYWRRP